MFDGDGSLLENGDGFGFAYMDVKTISPYCANCKRLDVDTIGGEKYKIERNPDGSTRAVPNGYENTLECKHFEECKKIFEEGYHVEPERPEPNIVLEAHIDDVKKIEKKPTTRKPRKPVVKKEKESKKTTTKKAAAKK